MSVLDHKQLLNSFSSDLMKGNVERLEMFDLYHYLRKASFSAAIVAQDNLGVFPAAFLEWMKYCDGGLLFDTVMLSSKDYDKEFDIYFDTFADYNSAEAKEEMGLPEEYSVFAVRSYGDPICFHSMNGDEKVYLWNVEEAVFEEVWDTFEDWLTEEIDSAIQLIGEEVLDPIELKLGEE